MQTPREQVPQTPPQPAPQAALRPSEDVRAPQPPVALEPYWLELCDGATD